MVYDHVGLLFPFWLKEKVQRTLNCERAFFFFSEIIMPGFVDLSLIILFAYFWTFVMKQLHEYLQAIGDVGNGNCWIHYNL